MDRGYVTSAAQRSNIPAYTSNLGGQRKSMDEPDTCRICRGEGTDTDELFYPCKCSGSIKFVHQGCLMQWLSHSQKKYCELCKTPFRFTKLYDPNMPEELPMRVFLRKLMVYGSRYLVTWMRFVLVAFVWLGWLPWSMRAVWRGLFWLADGRWPGSFDVSQQNTTMAPDDTLNSLAATGTSPATSTLASNSLPAPTSVESIAMAIPHLLSPVSSMLNFSAGEPLIYSVVKSVFSSSFVTSSNTSSASDSGPGNTAVSLRRLRRPSWLSDIAFLNTLTPYPTVNNIVIDTLEGQLITLLVVVSFIIVFLIREWVIQQQPGLNIAEDEREAAIRLMAEEPANRRDQHPPRPAEEQDPMRDALPQEPEPGPVDEVQGAAGFQTPIFGPRQSTEFHVPDFGAPLYPLDREPTRNSTSEEANRAEGSLDTLRAYMDAADTQLQEPSILSDPSPTEWELFRGDGGLLSPSSSTTGHSEEKGKQKLDEDQAAEEQAGEISHPLKPTAPLFRLNHGESSSQPFPHSFGSTEHALDTEPKQQAPSSSNGDGFYITRDSDTNLENGARSHSLQAGDKFPDLSDLEPPPTPASWDRTPDDRLGSSDILREPQEEPQANLEILPTANHQHGLAERIADWFWGDIPVATPAQQNEGHDDARVVENVAQEAPFVPVGNRGANFEMAGDVPEVQQVGGPDANEADAVDDADDLEGIMELIGMQGPIFGLLQNGVFSALLISFTVAVGIWLPYLWGKIALVLLTNPIRFFIGVPLSLVSVIADVAADTFIGLFAYTVYLGNFALRLLLAPLGTFAPALQTFSGKNAVTTASLSLMKDSGQRLRRVLVAFLTYNDSDLPLFSVLSHQALRVHQARINAVFRFFYQVGRTVIYDFPLRVLTSADRLSLIFRLLFAAPAKVQQVFQGTKGVLGNLPALFARNVSWSYLRIMTDGNGTIALDPELARWDTKDRTIAIIVGYSFATMIGLAYLRGSAYFNGSNHQQRVNGAVADALRQAGGVLKVILIIGIEMIVFPLYCGILIDIALLPLFETVTVMSRFNFTMESPWTSLFVHWFVGTCYMFHFALFVSMCRKILRTGVLYFIRDPDDPTFHPVRDVLERSIATQLRKIGFSALVYGALVIICLGGVVWGLFFAAKGVLPLHWSSNEPVLEFPVDLLFYNFVVPLAIQSLKPSDSLHQMYDWWFHKCARMLRLSSFLFGDREPDEEGHYTNRTWYEALITRLKTPPVASTTVVEVPEYNKDFIRDGKLVRAPASDQVRIPKGVPVFVEVNENNERVDGEPDREDGLHGRANEMFTKVYIPPSFRTRISLFILLVWLFAAVTGVSATILPLILGRRIMSSFFPEDVRVNDIYAFSVGVCVVGTFAYAILYCRQAICGIKDYIRQYSHTPLRFALEARRLTCHIFRLTYAYSALLLFLPSVLALISEFYILIPLHTYLYDDKVHVIYFVQDWTLGVLYMRMVFNIISWYPTSRLARAFEAVVRDGWLNPDIRLATRALIIPTTTIALFSLFGPLPLGFLLNATIFRQSPPAFHAMVYRYSYPALLMQFLVVLAARRLKHQVGVWRTRIRDDVYLIGERLHNFGERRSKDMSVPRRQVITS
ncbi:hypothetical protein VTO42DRAFT_6262 [Malbranchea cinnamomea]